MKTYIRTFRSDNTKIHDIELNGGQDDVRVALFCVRRAVAADGFAVVVTQNDAVSEAVHEAFFDGYIGALANAEGGAAFSSPCKALNGWILVKVYSEGSGERASESPVDDVSAETWELVQYVDYCENQADYYAEDVSSL